jgi:hypothetical protein
VLSDVIRLQAGDGVLSSGGDMFVDSLLDSVMIIPDKTGSAAKTEDAESDNYEQMTRAGLY